MSENHYVDYNIVSNKIHYKAFSKGHKPKGKKAYDTVRLAWLALWRGTYVRHCNLRKMFYVCKCPKCGKFHLVPKNVVRDCGGMCKFIVNRVENKE